MNSQSIFEETKFYCSCRLNKNTTHFILNTNRVIICTRDIRKKLDNPRIFTRVRAQTGEQTNWNYKYFSTMLENVKNIK